LGLIIFVGVDLLSG